MTDLRQAAQQALEALESWERVAPDLSLPEYDRAIITLRTALEQQAEPVAVKHGVIFLMHGEKMAFRIGNQQFTLDYQPSEPGEFEFMRDAIIHALSHFTPSVKNDFAAQQAEPVAHAVIVGALFDFMGWLTTRKERLVLSSTDNASPAADATKDFAEMRGLSLDDARVQDWQNYTTPLQRQWDKPSTSFNDWWNGDYDDAANPFEKDSAAYWLWAGWQAAQRQWVGLTDEDFCDQDHEWIAGASWAEAKLKEKNNG